MRWKSRNHLTLLKVVLEHETFSLGGSRCPGTHASPCQWSTDAQRVDAAAEWRALERRWGSTTYLTKRIKERVTHAWSLSTSLDPSVKSSFTFQFLKSVGISSSIWPNLSCISAQMNTHFFMFRNLRGSDFSIGLISIQQLFIADDKTGTSDRNTSQPRVLQN